MNTTKRSTVLNTEYRRDVIMYRMCMKDNFVLRNINIRSRALVVCENLMNFHFLAQTHRSVVLCFNTSTFKDIGYSCCISLS